MQIDFWAVLVTLSCAVVVLSWAILGRRYRRAITIMDNDAKAYFIARKDDRRNAA